MQLALTLYRHAYLSSVTLGRLYATPDLILPTLEEAWRPNPDGPGGASRRYGQRESCIPDGRYRVVPHTRAKDGARVWALVNPDLCVQHTDCFPKGQRWGRSEVLIHRGNTIEDTEGCILVGKSFGKLGALDAVLDSGTAIQELQALLGHDEEHTLLILPTTGTTERGVP